MSFAGIPREEDGHPCVTAGSRMLLRPFQPAGYLYLHLNWNEWFGHIPLRGVPGAIFIEVGEARTKKHVRTEQFKFK